MAQANIWQDEYAISRTAAIGTAATFALASGEIGVDTNKFGMYLNSHPDLDPGQGFVDQLKTTGKSTRVARVGASGTIVTEYRPSIRNPASVFDFQVTPKQIALPLWMLFQSNVTEGVTTPFSKVYAPANSASTTTYETFASILRKTGDPAESHVIHGCVCSQIAFAAAQGEALVASCSFIGKTYAQNFDMSAITLAYADEAPLMFQDCVVELASTVINIDGLSLNLAVNHVPKHHNAQTITKFVLGMLMASGSIDFPLANATVGDMAQRQAFIDGTPKTLAFKWGTASTLGQLWMEMNVRYTGAPVGGDAELISSLPFEVVFDEPATIDDAIKITLCDAVDRGI